MLSWKWFELGPDIEFFLNHIWKLVACQFMLETVHFKQKKKYFLKFTLWAAECGWDCIVIDSFGPGSCHAIVLCYEISLQHCKYNFRRVVTMYLPPLDTDIFVFCNIAPDLVHDVYGKVFRYLFSIIFDVYQPHDNPDHHFPYLWNVYTV